MNKVQRKNVQTASLAPWQIVATRIGIWGWGGFLSVAIVFIVVVLSLAAGCVLPPASKDAMPVLANCEPWVQGWYVVLSDWQTGVGAGIGLLGVAWSTFFKGLPPTQKDDV